VSKPEFPHFVWFRKSHDIPVYASIYIYVNYIPANTSQKPETEGTRTQKPKTRSQKPKTRNKKGAKKNNPPLYIYT
jgi:hypothetical protein